MIEFNVNHYAWVKLTDRGQEILQGLPYATDPKADEEGWSRWQLWDLMETFGSSLYCGSNPPFETTIRLDYTPPAPVSKEG